MHYKNLKLLNTIIIKILIVFDYIILRKIKRNLKNSVCIVKLDNIGDYVIFFQAAKAIKNNYKGRKFIIISNKNNFELLNEANIYDEILLIDLNRFTFNIFYRFSVIRNIYELGIEICICPTYSRDFLVNDSIVRATNAKFKIGFTGDNSNQKLEQKKISDTWYTDLININSHIKSEHKRLIIFLKKLNIDYIHKVHIPISKNYFITKENYNYYILNPGASDIKRRWPVDSFVKIVNHIDKLYNLKLILCGSSDEWKICDLIIKNSISQKGINLAGKLNLIKYIEYIRAAKFLIGNDSSGIHLASAVNTPSICIHGGGHPGRFLPYPYGICKYTPNVISIKMDCFGCNWNCVYELNKNEPYPCISKINYIKVCIEVDKLMNNAIF